MLENSSHSGHINGVPHCPNPNPVTQKTINLLENCSHGASVSKNPIPHLGKRPRGDFETQGIQREEEIDSDEKNRGTKKEIEDVRSTPEQQIYSLYKRALENNNPNFKICCPDGRVFYWERDDLLDLVRRGPFWVTTSQMDTCLHLWLEKSESKWGGHCHICCSDTIGQLTGLNKMEEDAADSLKQQLHHLLQDVQYNLIPFNLGHHWHLIIICGLEGQTSSNPQIWHLNSLEFISINEEMKNAIKQAVEEKTGKSAAWSDLQVPQQSNSNDCGFFVIKFVCQFINNLISPHPQDFIELMARQTHNKRFGVNVRSSFQKQMLWTLFQKQTDPPLQILPTDFDDYIKAFSNEDRINDNKEDQINDDKCEDAVNKCGK